MANKQDLPAIVPVSDNESLLEELDLMYRSSDAYDVWSSKTFDTIALFD